MTPQDAEDRLRAAAAARDKPLDLAGTAIALAYLDRPERPVDAAVDHLAQLADRMKAAAESAPGQNLAANPADLLAAVLHETFGYDGNREDYENLENADLVSVIAHRRGLPVALAILYIHAARAAGWSAFGLGYPAHFLIRVDAPAGAGHPGPAVLDPFNGGRTVGPGDIRALLQQLGAAEALQPDRRWEVSDRDILLRLQNNIRLRRMGSGDVEGGLAVLARMRLMAPDQALLALEHATVLARVGAVKGATETLKTYLAGPFGDPHERRELQNLLAAVESRLN